MKNTSTTFLKLAITYLSFIFLAILFTSCSKEDDIFIDDETSVPTLCVKRTVNYSSEWSVDTKIYDYNYDGTRLLDLTETRINNNDTTTTTYTNIYIGDNITSMIVDNSYNNSTIYYDFEYDTQGRVTKQFKDNSLEFTYTYIGYVVEKYDADTILVEEQTYDAKNNNTQVKYMYGSTWETLNVTHDNKNMPFKNVDSWYPLSGYRYISSNNTIQFNYSSGNSTTMSISYDANDFPTYITTSYSDGKSKSETLEYNN
tara:strand:+ start:5204 stop:5974 length:771 start_codon:yes stop_codon:yes gene_type:complete